MGRRVASGAGVCNLIMKQLKYKLLLLLGVLIVVFFPRECAAGTFTLVNETEGAIVYTYTGSVDFGDTAMLRELDAEVVGKQKELVVIIDSPGGAAYEGVDLYWAAKELNLITIAGSDFGAYSAAAMFWAGGSGEMMEGSLAGFHLAYCNPYSPPGCWVADIDGEMLKCLLDRFGRVRTAELFNQMNIALETYGVNGFVMFKAVDGELIVKVEDPTKYVDNFPSAEVQDLKDEVPSS